MEPAVRSTNSDIENEIKVLIKWTLISSGIPWVNETGAIRVGEREVASLPERLIEVGVEDLQETGVDVGEEILLAPFKTESVGSGGEGGVKSIALNIRSPPRIVGRIGAPVQRAGDNVVTSLCVGVIIAAGLNNVDLARCGPWSIDGIVWQHPDCRPQPVAGRESSSDFNTTVFDGSAFLGVDTTRLDRVDDGSVGDVGGSNAVGMDARSTDTSLGEVENVISFDELRILKSWFDNQFAALNENVFVCDCGFFELTVA